jgi:uncharacterized protein (DUF427 family)
LPTDLMIIEDSRGMMTVTTTGTTIADIRDTMTEATTIPDISDIKGTETRIEKLHQITKGPIQLLVLTGVVRDVNLLVL